MTGRVVRPDVICCVKDCGALGAFHMDARIWAASDPERRGGALKIETGLVVCKAHQAEPVQTAPEFFGGDEQRKFVDALCDGLKIERPCYATAQWLFPPFVKPAEEVAH